MRIRSKPAAASNPRTWSSLNPSQTWPICCRYSSRSCGSMSAITSRAPGFRTRAASASAAAGSGRWCRTRSSVAASSSPSAIGSDSSSPRLTVTLRRLAQPPFRRLQHLSGPVDGDHARDKGSQRGGHVAGAAAEVADDPALVEERGQRLQMRHRPEQICAQLVPMPRRRVEELLLTSTGAAPGHLQPPRVLIGAGRGADLLTQERPQPPR